MPDTLKAALVEALGQLSPAERERVTELTTYHAPAPDQLAGYEAINEAARLMLATILLVTPKCPDQSAAVRLVREARMTANSAIACRGVS